MGRDRKDIRSRVLAQMTRQTLEISVPVDGHKIVRAVLLISIGADELRTVAEELLQPGNATLCTRTGRQPNLDSLLLQRDDIVNPDLRGFIREDIAPSVLGRPVGFVKGQHVADVAPVVYQVVDGIAEGRVLDGAP